MVPVRNFTAGGVLRDPICLGITQELVQSESCLPAISNLRPTGLSNSEACNGRCSQLIYGTLLVCGYDTVSDIQWKNACTDVLFSVRVN